MAFINVNKVTLEETDNGKEAMSSVVLLMASLIYDDVKSGDYDKALEQLEGLKHAVMSLDYILKQKVDKKIEDVKEHTEGI